MSVNMVVVGFRAPDEEWNKHLAVWKACEAAGVEIPDATLEFFDHEDPSGNPGMEIALGDAAREFKDEYREGYEIDITKLPHGLRFIRAYLS